MGRKGGSSCSARHADISGDVRAKVQRPMAGGTMTAGIEVGVAAGTQVFSLSRPVRSTRMSGGIFEKAARSLGEGRHLSPSVDVVAATVSVLELLKEDMPSRIRGLICEDRVVEGPCAAPSGLGLWPTDLASGHVRVGVPMGKRPRPAFCHESRTSSMLTISLCLDLRAVLRNAG